MPIQIDVFNFKCFNQLRNGTLFDQNTGEYTASLVGNIGEKLKVTYTVNIGQSSNTEGVEEWDFVLDVNEIRRSSGSFLDDGIQVGDQYLLYPDWEARKTPGEVADYEGLVEFISSDGMTLRYSVVSGTPTVTGVNTNVGLSFDQAQSPNINTAAFLRFGLLDNDETFNFISKTTENQQVYYAGSLQIVVPQVMESLGIVKDWVSGNASIEYVGIASPGFREAQYLIEHEFVLNPFYILAYRQNIENSTVPALLAGDSSIKYAAELEFRKSLTNTGSSKSQIFDGLEGFVGWYGENFNGLNSKYRILSIVYEDALTTDSLEGVNINASTKAIITVENIGGSVTDYSCGVYLFRVPTSENDYIGTTTNLLENFIYKSEVISSPDTTSPNVTTSIVSGNLVIEYTIDYAIAERLRLTTEDEYILLVQIEDPNLTAGNSDRVMLIADFRNYVDVDFLAGFIQVGSQGVLTHGQVVDVNAPNSAAVLSNEDGVLLQAVFGASISKSVTINAISGILLAYNPITGNSFQLDRYDFSLGDVIFSGGRQQIIVEGLRGYPLPDGDQFNLVRIETLPIDGDFAEFELLLGQKITWQDWILNTDVDDVFFDGSKPNNNLNERSSNYSAEQDYNIRLALVINVTGLDDIGRTITGDFISYGGVLTVNDYDESADGVSGVIQTFDVDSGASLDGNVLYNGKDTLFRAVFQNAVAMTYGIHRIEPSQNPGDGILELSSVLPSVPNNLLKPVDGETLLKFDLLGSVLTTECLIDGSLIQEGVQYKLSARVGQLPIELTFFSQWDTSNTSAGSSAVNQIELPLVNTGTYNFVVDWGDGTQDTITQWDQPETTHTYGSPGVYDVKIGGTLRGWQFANNRDRLKLLDISQWGGFVFLSDSVFYGCAFLDVSAADTPLIESTLMTNTFRNCVNLTNLTDNWDLSGVTNMNSFFQNASLFNSDIGGWDVSNVTSFRLCFSDAYSFNGNVELWDVSSATDLFGMFNMFITRFLNPQFNRPVGSWNVDNVTIFESVFSYCESFNQDVSNWNVSNATTIRSLFSDTAFNQPLTTWNTQLSNVNSMVATFANCVNFNQDITGWDVSSVTDMRLMFAGTQSFTYDISVWDISNLANMNGMFQDSNFNVFLNWGNKTIGVTDMSNMFKGNASWNQSADNWNVSTVLNMSGMFNGCQNMNQSFASWDVSSVTDMSSLFENCFAFDGTGLQNWNVSNVTNLERTFYRATVFNEDISSWNPSPTNIGFCFFAALAFNRNLNNWNTNGVANFNNVFQSAQSFNQPITWDTSNCISFFSMFENAQAFDQNLGGLNIQNSLGGSRMFLGATALSTANLDNLIIGWAAQAPSIQNNGIIDAPNTARSVASDAAVTLLTGTYGWTINTL